VAYTTVGRNAEHAETVKGSRFLAWARRVDDEEAARGTVEEARARFPDASHHCSAWRIGARLAADDDGEPGGTAGRPMLEVLLKRDLDHVAVVCVRWFGGTKLGAGGLVRAYGGTAAKALDAAGTRFVPDLRRGRVIVPYPRLDVVHRLLDGWPRLAKGDADFAADGAALPVELLADDVDALRTRLADVSAGEVELRLDEG
jgi:uncharacterized YigZ family protein